MIRNIKFRGKRIDSDEWVYGHFIRGGNKDEQISLILPLGESTATLVKVIPNSVGQLVYITKDGQEVYEGDLLKNIYAFENSDEHAICILQWDPENCSYILKCLNSVYDHPINWIKQFVLAGNIFDTPM